MSLEILNPPKQTHETSTPTQERDISLAASKAGAKCPICNNAGPEELSRQLIHLFNDHSFQHPLLSHVTRSFRSEQDIIPSESSEDYYRQRRNWVLEYPEYHLEILRLFTEMDETAGKAKVWTFIEVTGHPPGVRRHSITIMHWRRRQDEWLYYKREGVRGPALF